jgi:hypothetical protein
MRLQGRQFTETGSLFLVAPSFVPTQTPFAPRGKMTFAPKLISRG